MNLDDICLRVHGLVGLGYDFGTLMDFDEDELFHWCDIAERYKELMSG